MCSAVKPLRGVDVVTTIFSVFMHLKSVCSVPGDAGSFLVRLSKGLKGHRCPAEWPQSLKAGDETKENANRCTEHRTRLRCLQATDHLHILLTTVLLSYSRVKADEKTDHHLNPLKVLHCVDELMAEDSIIVADGGDFVGSAAYIMRPRGPMRWLDPGFYLLTCLNT